MEDRKLTAKEIFVQLTILQNQLTESSNASLHRLGDAITSIGEEENEVRYEQIAEVCGVFEMREIAFVEILKMYQKMYNDIQNEESKKVELIKSAFDSNMAMIKDSDMETQDKFAALGYVTDKIAELVEKVVIGKED